MLTTASSAVLHATRSSAVLAGLVPALGVGLRAQLGDGLGHHEAHALADYLSAEALCDHGQVHGRIGALASYGEQLLLRDLYRRAVAALYEHQARAGDGWHWAMSALIFGT